MRILLLLASVLALCAPATALFSLPKRVVGKTTTATSKLPTPPPKKNVAAAPIPANKKTVNSKPAVSFSFSPSKKNVAAAPIPANKKTANSKPAVSFSSTFMVADSIAPKKSAPKKVVATNSAPNKVVATNKKAASSSKALAGLVGESIALYRKENKNSAKSDSELSAVFQTLAKTLGSEASAAVSVKNVPSILNAQQERIVGNFKVYSDKFGADKARGMVERNPCEPLLWALLGSLHICITNPFHLPSPLHVSTPRSNLNSNLTLPSPRSALLHPH